MEERPPILRYTSLFKDEEMQKKADETARALIVEVNLDLEDEAAQELLSSIRRSEHWYLALEKAGLMTDEDLNSRSDWRLKLAHLMLEAHHKTTVDTRRKVEGLPSGKVRDMVLEHTEVMCLAFGQMILQLNRLRFP